MTRISPALLAAMFSVFLVQAVHAESLKSAAKTVNKDLKDLRITALVPLKFKAKYQIKWNGETWGEDKRQGKKTGLTRKGDMAFSEGDTAKLIWVKPKSDKKVLVRMVCCANKTRSLFSTTQHVDFIVRSDMPIDAADITPARIATALSGFFDFEGFSLNEAVSVLSNLEGPGSTNYMVNESAIARLGVEAVPQKIRHGQSVSLDLAYYVRAPDKKVQIIETRTLSFNGNKLPGYPSVKQYERQVGQYKTKLSQRIPESASIGSYTYEGKVCVAGDCVSRTIVFTVTD